MKHSLVLIALLSLSGVIADAQTTGPDIKKYVEAVSQGNADEVRNELPDLVTKYPNHPGVMYLQGLVTREGSEAIRTYQSLVDNFPESEWADDALYKVYQFYYALGLYRTAEIKMKQLVEKYPASPYVKNVPVQAADDAAAIEKATEKPSGSPVTEPVPARADSAVQVRFVLQVGAFGLQNNAQILKDRFEASGYPVEMISKVKDTRSLFIVRVGNYGTYDEARIAAQDVRRKMGVDAIVISR
jgi:cell division septation protein DedD